MGPVRESGSDEPSTPKRGAHRWRWLRDAWLVFGLAGLWMVALEAAYRGQANLRRSLRGGDVVSVPADHPYAGEAWWAEWLRGEGGWRSGYDPYRALWPEPRSGPHLNIDSLGRRRTVQEDPAPGRPRRRIVLLGGSTMFGYTARDAATIPSHLADLLEAEGIHGTTVVNLAQSSFNVTQGLNTLILELRAGRVPDLVVFLDGNNEIAPAFQSGRAGGVLNQAELERRHRNTPPALADRLLGVFTFIGRIGTAVGLRDAGEGAGGPEPPPWADPPGPLCDEVAGTYLAVREIVERLGEAWGFETFFFWQPMWATSGKTPTSYERSIGSPAGWRPTVAACTQAVRRRAEAARARLEFMDDLFDDETESVFLDDYGHVTEAANRVIAQAILSTLRPALDGPSGADGEG